MNKKMEARTKKRARISTNPAIRHSNKKSRQALSFPVSAFSPVFSSTFSPTTPLFTWTPQPVPRTVSSSVLLQEMMNEMKEQRKIMETIATQQQELIKDVKTIMTTMGLDDSKPEMMDAEYNYYA